MILLTASTHENSGRGVWLCDEEEVVWGEGGGIFLWGGVAHVFACSTPPSTNCSNLLFAHVIVVTFECACVQERLVPKMDTCAAEGTGSYAG